jgi:hypothetical protein
MEENKKKGANATALKKVEDAQKVGALIFVDPGFTDGVNPLYKPDLTIMKIEKDDCFNISGKFMPKRHIVDRIADACGITFIMGETKAVPIDDNLGRRVVYSAFAQAQKLMPDGSYRQSSVCTYDFDYVLRAVLDYDVTELNEKTKLMKRNGKDYGSTLARYILELQKVASQRANTGARLRAIRELAGMPESFAEKDILRPLAFGRMIQNTDYILNTNEGREAATLKALGCDVSSLFGRNNPALSADTAAEDNWKYAETPEPEGGAEPENGSNAANPAPADMPDFPAEEGEAKQEQSEFEYLTGTLEEYLTYKEHHHSQKNYFGNTCC